jgi:tRNA-2-methylthio-N6-dimethylallyladenosine synthase
MEAIRDLKTLCEFVHFPLQAGANRVLKKMHRIYTVEQYLEKVQMLREIVPNVALGTDIIVGFPTETEEEFQETYRLLKEIEYSVAFLFSYSPRKGTPAMRWKDDIPEEVKQDRLQRLIQLQDEIYAKQRQSFLGEVLEVLVEKRSSKNDRLLKGRTRCWKNVLFEGDDQLIGTLQNVKVHSYSHQTLLGNLYSS